MSKKTVTQAVTNIVQELTDFTSEERHRIVRASLMLLGEASAEANNGANSGQADDGSLPAKARSWMKQHGLSTEQVSEVFHIGGDDIDIIASIPGKTKKEQVRNAYVLLGISRLLKSGETKFEDKAARELCEKGGFFDHTNHMKYMKGSEFTGSRDKGWVLTAPGLKLGASLVAQLGNH
jgi:hypothetical protein